MLEHEEQVERVRQAIMRYREILDLLHTRVEAAERSYNALFEQIPAEKRDSLQEKQLQREAALIALENMTPLQRALLRARFDMRDFEKEFDETYNNIAPEEDA